MGDRMYLHSRVNEGLGNALCGGYIHPDSTLHNLHLIVSPWNTELDWPDRAMQFVTGVE
jgi:hypothetical protein